MYNRVKKKIGFGKYKGLLISEILAKDPEYIIWCIRNLDNFLINFSFLRDAIMINEKFRIPTFDILNFEKKMDLYNKKMEEDSSADLCFEDDYNYKKNYSYRKWLEGSQVPYLIMVEKFQIKELEKEEKKRIEQIEEWRIEAEERNILNNEICDFNLYDDNLQADEQSEDFWNQF